MAEKRKRIQNFSSEEKEKLLKLLLMHRLAILDKKTDDKTIEAKKLAWTRITDSFNEMVKTNRTKKSLMEMWQKMKGESLLYYYEYGNNTTQSGCGSTILKIDPILEQVCSILGRGCNGSEEVDSDTIKPGYIEEANFPKVICLDVEDNGMASQPLQSETKTDTVDTKTDETKNKPQNANSEENIILTSTSWSRRKQTIERSQSMGDLCSSFKNMNKKKEDVKDLKCMLLKEKLASMKKIYQLQLDAANLDIKIKKRVLKNMKDGAIPK